MALSERKLNLAVNLLGLSCDDVGAKEIDDIDSETLESLADEFYEFSDKAGDVLIANGLGDESLDDLWRNVEFVWLCTRMGHGVSFGDDPWANADLGRIVSTALNALARDQGNVETYVGDDGRVYIL
jgi:hypothetical protein